MSDGTKDMDPAGNGLARVGGASGCWDDVSSSTTAPALTSAMRIPGASNSASNASAMIGGSGP